MLTEPDAIAFLHAQRLELEGEDEDEALPEFQYLTGNFLDRSHLDAYFSKLSVVPLQRDDEAYFLINDPNGQLLGKWPIALLPQVITKLASFNTICPGGATYVMLNSDLIIRQWKLNVEHFRKKALASRVADLPQFREGQRGDKQTKAVLTNSLLDEMLGGGND